MSAFTKTSPSPVSTLHSEDYFTLVKLQLCRDDPGRRISYWSKPGVFSYRRPDAGTELLAGSLPELHERAILDMACGSGVLGLLAAKLGAEAVTCLDNSAIATQCAELNFQEHVDQTKCKWRILCASIYSGMAEQYHTVIANPPFHTDKKTDYHLGTHIIRQSEALLLNGGALYLVGNSFIPYENIGKKHFESVTVANRDKGYTVYRMEKK